MNNIQYLFKSIFKDQTGEIFLHRLNRVLEVLRSGLITGASNPVLQDVVQRPCSMPALSRATHGAHTTNKACIPRARIRRRNADDAHSALDALAYVGAFHFRHICCGCCATLALVHSGGSGGDRWRHVRCDILYPNVTAK